MSNDAMYIKTGLTDIISEDVLKSVIGQMSDGMWENSKIMEHYWPFVDIERVNNKHTSADEVYIVVDLKRDSSGWHQNNPNNNWFWNSTKYNCSHERIKKFFANKIQTIVREDLNDHEIKWSRFSAKNDYKLQYISSYHKDADGNYPPITVSDAHKVYTALKH